MNATARKPINATHTNRQETTPNKVPQPKGAAPMVLSFSRHTPAITVDYAERMGYALRVN